MILSVVATAAASLTLLPAVLVLLGHRVFVDPPSPGPRPPPGHRAAGPGGQRRPCAGRAPPWPPGSDCLLVLAAPAQGMRLGCPAPVSSIGVTRAVTATTPSRRRSVRVCPPRCTSPSRTPSRPSRRHRRRQPGCRRTSSSPSRRLGPRGRAGLACHRDRRHSYLRVGPPSARPLNRGAGGPCRARHRRTRTSPTSSTGPHHTPSAHPLGRVHPPARRVPQPPHRTVLAPVQPPHRRRRFGFATIVFQHARVIAARIEHQLRQRLAPLFFFTLLFASR